MARIELKPGAKPCRKSPFRTLGEREEGLQALIDKYIERGWIVPSKSEWAAQAFVVPKPPNPDKPGVKQWRMVIDYRYLNSQTKDDSFPLPLIEDLITKQSMNRLWSIFDLEDGFHQMHLAPECSHLTAFVTPIGCYEFTVLHMGVKNGPAMFQRTIQWVLKDLPFALVYIDDVLVGTPGTDPKLHYKQVLQVLNKFKEHGLSVKSSKMHLFQTCVKFCGHMLFNGQRKAIKSKLEAVAKWTPDMVKTVTHLKGFLGLCQYYATYMKNFAGVAAPLFEQLKNRDASNKKIEWNDNMIVAFNAVKRDLLENVVLDIADPLKPYVLEVDSSDYAVGGVLSQENSLGELRPVAFFSRKLQGSKGLGQLAWSIREKETYAIVLILHKFRRWLASTVIEVRVLSDHESLKEWVTEDLNKMTSAVGRRGRWHEFLSQFNIVVVYVKGSEHHVSDPLSRWAYPAALEKGDESFHGSFTAQAYADHCDRKEDEYDEFPPSKYPQVSAGAVTPFCSIASDREIEFPYGICQPGSPDGDSQHFFYALSRKKKKNVKKPRKNVKAEISSPLFHSKWDYMKDPVYGPIKLKLDNNEPVNDYSWADDRLIHKFKYCVPAEIVPEVVSIYHQRGHPGITKLAQLLNARFSFSLTQRQIYIACEQVCKSCQVCQAVKPRSGRSPGTLDFCPIPDQIFGSLCMDFVDLPEITTKSGEIYNYAFVIVCRLSGFVEAIPCNKRGLTAEVAAELFLINCVKFMGLPNEILSDNDHLITSHFFTTLCELTGVEQHSSIIYRPQGNGRAEAAVKAVVSMLRKLCTSLREPKCNWYMALPWALHQINSLPGLLLHYSPFKIVFGRDPTCVGDVPASRRTRSSASCESWFANLQKLRKKVQELVTKIHQERSSEFRKKHSNPVYQPGDLVWVRNGPWTGPPGTKLDPLWTGPCEIIHRYGDTGRYKVALPQGPEDVHMEVFKPSLPPVSGNPIPFLY